MNQKKKALAVVAGPYRFYQILWLYSQYVDYEWSILLLQYGKNSDYEDGLQVTCEKLGIFENVYRSHAVGVHSGIRKQISTALKMMVYCLTGQKKKLMKKIILEQTKGCDFDVFFVGCEYSMIEGAVIGLSDEKEVFIFEEGLGDYGGKKSGNSFSMNKLIGFLFSKMGYFNPGGYYSLKGTKKCTKYSSVPELLKQEDFKEIRLLFDDKKNMHYFHKLLNHVYPVEDNCIDGYDVIFLTTPLDSFIKDNHEYSERLHKWFVENYAGKRILIKKHPRDTEHYDWNELDISFLKADVPAERFMELLGEQKVVLMFVSTMLLSLIQRKKDFIVIKFADIYGEYESSMDYTLNLLQIDDENIIIL